MGVWGTESSPKHPSVGEVGGAHRRNKRARLIVSMEAASVDPMADVGALLADLGAESEVLDRLVSALSDEQWRTATPAPGWTIAHQIAHLGWTDELALVAATDPDAFGAEVAALFDGTTSIDETAAAGAARPPAELLAWWRDGRAQLAAALSEVPPGSKLPWFGPPMGAASMATARLMETWAHGQDVADAVGVPRQSTDRLRHVAHIGVRARDYAYRVNGLTPPADEFRVELAGPSGDHWTWGPADATQRVTGPALDFCLLVTQRRHRDDLAVTAEGADAEQWLTIAQAFAGPPGTGRAPERLA
jgi:uncharacterized protein (TIGR03084 family)